MPPWRPPFDPSGIGMASIRLVRPAGLEPAHVSTQRHLAPCRARADAEPSNACETARAEAVCIPLRTGVLLVVNGGLNSLRVVRNSLKQEQPVVALADSGGCATHIARLFHDNVLPPQEEMMDDRLTNVQERTEYVELLKVVVELGRVPHGAAQRPLISFFWKTSDSGTEGGAADLDKVIAQAILSDCDKMQNAVQHAVMWGQPEIVEDQLRASKAHDPLGLSSAFQHVLLQAAESQDDDDALRMVELLMRYDVQPRMVALGPLWIPKVLPTYMGGALGGYGADKDFVQVARIHPTLITPDYPRLALITPDYP